MRTTSSHSCSWKSTDESRKRKMHESHKSTASYERTSMFKLIVARSSMNHHKYEVGLCSNHMLLILSAAIRASSCSLGHSTPLFLFLFK